MALVSIQRSPTPSPTHELPLVNATNKIFRSHFDSKSCDTGGAAESDSLSEYYFAVRGAAVILPKNEFQQKRETCNGGEIQQHLQSMLQLLRPRDTLRMAVRLQNMFSSCTRYLVITSTSTRHGNRESALLGIDYITPDRPAIALILPIWSNTIVKLDGDGGISVESSDSYHLFKPISVQAMWSVFQALHKELLIARNCPMFHCRISQSWLKYYEKKISSPESIRSEWYYTFQDSSDLKAATVDCYKEKPPERAAAEDLIRNNLKNIMHSVDLDEVTSKDIRNKLEEKLQLDLSDYRDFIDHEMLVILGQMDTPSMVFPYLYLGTEWNASNWDELKRNNVGFILNVAKEVDNFFPGLFEYMNVRVSDEESSELLKYWEATSKFIVKAKMQKSAVLVHCKKGISRSSSTVIAYAMKEYGLPLNDALNYVKNKRNCITPNKGFMEQLRIYQGILLASRNRNSYLWNRLSLPVHDYTAQDSRFSLQLNNRAKSKQKGPLNRSASLMSKTNSLLRDVTGDVASGTHAVCITAFKKCPSTADLCLGHADGQTALSRDARFAASMDHGSSTESSVEERRAPALEPAENDDDCSEEAAMTTTFYQPRPKLKRFANLQERLRQHSLNLNCVRDILTRLRGAGSPNSDNLSPSSSSDSDSGSCVVLDCDACAKAATATIARRERRSSSSDSAVVADLAVSVASAEFCDALAQDNASGSAFHDPSLYCSRSCSDTLQSVSLNSSPCLTHHRVKLDQSEVLDVRKPFVSCSVKSRVKTFDRADRSRRSCQCVTWAPSKDTNISTGDQPEQCESCSQCRRSFATVQSQLSLVEPDERKAENGLQNNHVANIRIRCKSEPVSFVLRHNGSSNRATAIEFSCGKESSLVKEVQEAHLPEATYSESLEASVDSLTNRSSFYPSVRRLASSLELQTSHSSEKSSSRLLEDSVTRSPVSNPSDSMVRSLVGYFESNKLNQLSPVPRPDPTDYDSILSPAQSTVPSFYLSDCRTSAAPLCEACEGGEFILPRRGPALSWPSTRRSFHCLQEFFNRDSPQPPRALKRNSSYGQELKSSSCASPSSICNGNGPS